MAQLNRKELCWWTEGEGVKWRACVLKVNATRSTVQLSLHLLLHTPGVDDSSLRGGNSSNEREEE